MKIISGRFKGRSIKISKGSSFRPTLSRIREDIFNLLQHNKTLNVNFEDLVFYDLFCGSGSIGLEALSRGAKKVIFNDIDSLNVQLVKDFLDTEYGNFSTDGVWVEADTALTTSGGTENQTLDILGFVTTLSVPKSLLILYVLCGTFLKSATSSPVKFLNSLPNAANILYAPIFPSSPFNLLILKLLFTGLVFGKVDKNDFIFLSFKYLFNIYALALNFDGVSLITVEDLNTLENLIRE